MTRVEVGDRIAGTFHPRWFGGPIRPEYLTDRLGANLDGMLAEYAVLSEEALVHVPSHLSFEEAATLPCAAVTAWVALTGDRRINAGDTVLTQGSGGVSVFALQFARLLGTRVIATTSTGPCCTDRRLAARSGGYRRARPFLTLDRHRAIQSEPKSPSSHPEAAAQSDELGGL